MSGDLKGQKSGANELAVLVQSCDKFADAWNPFFDMYQKFWPDCGFNTYLVSETLDYDREGVISIKPGQLMEWSARLEWALRAIPEPYVLLLLEDYVLLKPVDNQRIIEHLDILKEHNAAYLRLIPAPPPDEPLPGHESVGVIKKGAKYRNSTQAAIWNKECLLRLIDPKENVWDFELVGVHRTNDFDEPFLSVKLDENGYPLDKGDYPFTYFCTAIMSGKWSRRAVKMIEANGVKIDLAARPQETILEDLRRSMREFYFNYILRIPRGQV